ncbi:MAG: histidine phosphatase family protein [Clostridia bacterium]|jgi:alpha-ribazole phosphatase|nr:histidine phosphatase family protein [Clostridia bacterium]
MKTYTVYLIRHALTQGNLEGRYIGQTDEELCKVGAEQLEKLKQDYGYPYPEVVFTSSLKRCKQTAQIIYPDKTPIEMRGFDECDFGEFEGRTAEELAPYEEFSQWLSGGEDARPLNGESNAEFATRVCDCFSKTIDGLIKTGTTSAAIVTHGGVIMSILAAFGLPEAPMTEWLCPSACGYTIRITPSLWSRVRKAEVINEIPSEPLTASQEEMLWDYYPEISDDESDFGEEE